MQNRLFEGKSLLVDTIGYYSIAIDDTELHNLYKVLEFTLPNYNIFQVIVNHYPGSGTGRSNVSKTHEYNLFAVKKNSDILRGKAKNAGERVRGFCRSGTGDNNFRYGRPNSFYAVLVDPTTHTIKGFEKPPLINEDYLTSNTNEGYLRVYPLGADGAERCWSLGYESANEYWKNDMLFCSDNNVIKRRYFDDENRDLLPSMWVDSKFSAVVNGTNLLTKMFGDSGRFPFPKSLYTVEEAIEAGTFDDKQAIVLDYFAGSGTTGHAVIDLNRKTNGNRKYILVEMGEYFELVTKTRVKKAIYSSEWDSGKPTEHNNGISQMMKYMRLESYEDALSNITLEEKGSFFGSNLGDEYLIGYMLDMESKGSLLNLDAFISPFEYNMKITEKNECKERQVDVIETFNYLIGLSVHSQSSISYFSTKEAVNPPYEGAVDLQKDLNGVYGFRQIEGTLPDGRKALIIWRNINQDNILASNAALDAYFSKYRINPADREFDVIYINRDNNLENLRLDDEQWKVVLIETEFNKRMWEE